MPNKTCPHCGCSEIDVDQSRGVACCTSCGSVIENSIIVNEVQFEENGHGGSSVLGQTVSLDGRVSGRYMPSGLSYGISRQSRQITLDNGRRRIIQLANHVQANQSCIEEACGIYNMAVYKNLTRGRRHSVIVASCLYMSCRLQGTAHILLDFSNALKVNVFDLGKAYLSLLKVSCLKPPATDPCIYIIRYASKLQFGDKEPFVIQTATRLVSRMKKDWIHFGRRPSGLCGAALLVAARLHEFNRTVNDIIKVVKVCCATLRKRLNEFGDTPSSRLTLSEFMTIDLEEEQDPPAFKNSRKKAAQKQQLIDGSIDDEAAAKEVSKLQKQIDDLLENRKSKHKGGFFGGIVANSKFTSSEANDASEFVQKSTLMAIRKVLEGDPAQSEVDADEEEIETMKDEEDITNEQMQTWRLAALQPTAESLGLNRVSQYQYEQPVQNDEDENGVLNLDGIDDDEINSYILTPDEASKKEDIWMVMYADYLKELKEKEEREAKLIEEGVIKPEKKKRKSRKNLGLPSSSAAEAIEKMLQEKKVSMKINYDVLDRINSAISFSSGALATSSSTSSKLDNETVEQEKKKRKVENSTPEVTETIQPTMLFNDDPDGEPTDGNAQGKVEVVSPVELAPNTYEDEADPYEEEEEEAEEDAIDFTSIYGRKEADEDDDGSHYYKDMDDYYDDD